jgi:hypothetical protein
MSSNMLTEPLYQRLKQDDRFFHSFIQIIPTELYKHTETMTGYREDEDDSAASESEENTESNLNSKYYKHRKQPLTADERKIKSQENKKRKYSSENAVSCCQFLLSLISDTFVFVGG